VAGERRGLALRGSGGDHTTEYYGPVAKLEAAQTPTLGIVKADGERVEVELEIADTRTEQARGLMERTELAENAGMLFVLESEQTPGFYMENTLIPLSIAFMDSEGRIVDIQDMQPLDVTRHYPAEPVQFALEVNQGFFAERGVQVGDRVELLQPGFVEPPSSAEVVQASGMRGSRSGSPTPWSRNRAGTRDRYLGLTRKRRAFSYLP
jgi:uncharacterized membrane protein (UPF0127 family)